MDVPQLRQYLKQPDEAEGWLRRMGLNNLRRAHANLVQIATGGVTLDLLAVICGQLTEYLAFCADPDMALNNLERFIAAARNPLSLAALFERDRNALSTLLRICSTSQHLSDLLVADPESFEFLRQTGGRPVSREKLVKQLVDEVTAVEDDRSVLRAIRRFKRRETLRVAYDDIIHDRNLAKVAAQISHVADAILEAALVAAWRKLSEQRGVPRGPDGERVRFVVLGMGKLGGAELNYSSDIDLIFLYDTEGTMDGRRGETNGQFFAELVREVVRLLTERTSLGSPYRVDLRLRPYGARGLMTQGLNATLAYYDLRARNWERQAMIKARAVAGDIALGREFLDRLQPWIYRRYLGQADIAEIKALKRRIERRAYRDGGDVRNVKMGPGGIRDIEFLVQFLQLLHGGDVASLRGGNTLDTIAGLESDGGLSNQESMLLQKNYILLRKIEHRLQIMFDLQTHDLPEDPEELRKLALRMGLVDSPERSALEAFEEDYKQTTQINRQILDHQLHNAFGDDADSEPEVDLVLDPDPPDEQIAEVLGKYSFADIPRAYRNLMALAEEKSHFLSTRRCRHFLASITRRLLKAIAATPDPDSTLVNLGQVSDALGGKGVLWELFSFNPPSLKMYVRLCAYSPYLSNLLMSNPGIVDVLMDSLVLDKLPSRKSLQRRLAERCRNVEDLDPALHSFKTDQELRVGVRDILGKADVRSTTESLCDIAETCLGKIAAVEFDKLIAKFGRPMMPDVDNSGQVCEMAILAMGKLGGRELNYHSDLDIIFLYEADGHTSHCGRSRGKQTTSNQHFFSELGQRIIKTTSHVSPFGRLYEIDARLRPTGKSGPLATPLAEFARYHASGDGQLWERQALCRAHVAVATPRMSEITIQAAHRAAFEHDWSVDDAAEIRRMRRRMQETATGADVKRGPGGIVDIEFVVQMLQLKHGREKPEIRQPNTIDALAALRRADYLEADDYLVLSSSYRFLRTLESRLRLMNITARDRLPDDPIELAKLADLLRWPSGEELMGDLHEYTNEVRRRFDAIFDRQ